MIGIHELVFLALAGYRLTQLGVHDAILDPLRDKVLDWQTRRPESGARAFIVTLITCIYCLGWWLNGAVLAAWLLWPDNRAVEIGVTWFALAGAAALLNRWDDSRKAAS
ncbi:membrane protein [Streptomyces phage TurkishDelight]|uniref:Membrane protein n=1 Tax=Streptomyces phage TurkishDelight TaxID=2793708 RepID=A0A7T0M0Y5_9CAUD|nr:membrane protein [Streptomyces phage TurkishDelight]QPL14039.1 membrane protein [Streptomyces phage TurkishDelight]